MFPVYENPCELEKLAKEKYCIPPFLMMENAAKSMADFILQKCTGNKTVLIVCGKGNNGGDGYALARLIKNYCNVFVLLLEQPTAQEAKTQFQICNTLGVKILNANSESEFSQFLKLIPKADFIVDCIYGTGFKGELKIEIKKLIEKLNSSKACKIACDISSGLLFNADFTFTMGEYKLALFSDKAKAVSGTIFRKEIGISFEDFEKAGGKSEANLIEYDDIELPLRKNKAAHKGKYGHTAVFCGEKSGAGILAASAAMNFGSGLTSLVPVKNSNLSQFKISPSLMISNEIPAKTTCVVLGSGFTEFPEEAAAALVEWFNSCKNPTVVLDATILTSPKLPPLLTSLDNRENARIVLTPHLLELSVLLKNIFDYSKNQQSAAAASLFQQDFSVQSLAENPALKLAIGKFMNQTFPNTAVVMKSANTFIAQGGESYIIADGSPSLAKGGSGDLLAGLIGALLAQGYSTKSACITAAEYHAHQSKLFGEQAFNLTPQKFLELML